VIPANSGGKKFDMPRTSEIVRIYRGKGQLLHGNFSDTPVTCSFKAVQFQNGNIRLDCSLRFLDIVRSLRVSGPLVNITFRGITKDGKVLLIEGAMFNSNWSINIRNGRVKPTVITYLLQNETGCQVGETQWDGEANVRFGLTNFHFIGTEVETVGTQSRLGLLPLEISGRTFMIRQFDDYEKRIDKIEQEERTAITCEGTVHLQDPSEITAVTASLDNLCKLLTLARGTLVSWLYLDVLSPHGGILYTVHRPAVTRPYVTDALIDPRVPKDTKIFVEAVYERYVELDPIYQLTKVIHTYVDVRSSGFLETRGLALVVLTEYLAGIFAKQTSRETIVDDQTFKERQEQLEAKIHQLVSEVFPDIKSDQAQAMAAKAKGFNYRSLRSKLGKLRKQFKVPITEEEIEKFVETRNSLAHTMVFRTDDYVAEFRWMVNLLDKILLRMLGYSGHYINALTNERELLIDSILK
jgi:hypothetical protein